MRVSEDLRGVRVLVTGAAGFIGHRLVSRLLAADACVATVDRSESVPDGVYKSFCGDVADSEFIGGVVREVSPGVLFHLAAVRARSAEVAAFRKTIDVNLLGSLSVLEACAESPGMRAAVFVGTAEEYGLAPVPYREGERELPVSAYSYSKLAMTELVLTLNRLHGLPAVILRPTVAYGPGQAPDMFIPALIAAVLKGERFAMTAGEQTRDFVFVDDLVDALLAASTCAAAAGRVVNIGSGEHVRIREVALLVEKLAGAEGLLDLGAIPYRAGEPMSYGVDASLALELLGWSAVTPLEEGLRLTVDAARSGS